MYTKLILSVGLLLGSTALALAQTPKSNPNNSQPSQTQNQTSQPPSSQPQTPPPSTSQAPSHSKARGEVRRHKRVELDHLRSHAKKPPPH